MTIASQLLITNKTYVTVFYIFFVVKVIKISMQPDQIFELIGYNRLF